MPGRQSHGRSLLGDSKSSSAKAKGKGKSQKSKSKSRAHALDAFAIAAKQIEPDRVTRRGRNLDLDPERESRAGKHRRDDEDEDDSDDEEEDVPQRKRAKKSTFEDDDEGANARGSNYEGGSDSEGNEWHIGVNSDDDDSDIDSDEAFGESDDDKFEGFTFRGSHSRKEEDGDSEDGGDDGASLGSDAIDLADALDQSSDSDEGSAGDTESGSEEDESADEDEEDGEDSEDDDVDPSKLGDLQNLIKGFADADEDIETGGGPASKQTISLHDLGLTSVKDPLIKKSVKLMKKEEKASATKKGISKKLDVPLPRRQQDQLLRVAAYEKTNEVLDRWNDTVKHNRRADHLMFPLAHTLPDAGIDNGELLPLTKKTAGNELEQTIMSIMEESGLGPSAKSKDAPKTTDANGEEQTISRADLKDLWAQRRKERELQSREQARAKRIKKIKSKTYRKIHRKERLGDEAEALEAMRENGEINSEEEREAAHRRRALERVGARHKDSKWAKMGSKAGRAVWDDDYRSGLTDMAQRSEELRRRVEGKTGTGEDDEDESDATSSSGDENGNSKLLNQLDALDDVEDVDDHPHANLLKLKFMQRAEAQKKKDNDELVAQIRRDLESGSEEEEDDTEAQMGRRTFGMGQNKRPPKPSKQSTGAVGGALSNGALNNGSKPRPFQMSKDLGAEVSNEASVSPSVPGAAGSWSRVGQSAVSERKKGRKAISSAEVAELDLNGAVQLASKAKPVPKSSIKTKDASASNTTALDDVESSEDDIHLPLAIRDIELASRAFAGEDTVAEFEAEKEAIMSEDDEKVIDKTMPGWGSWTGDGISKRAHKRNKGKVMTKKEGIKKQDRKDAKLERVIVNEKRNRKVSFWLMPATLLIPQLRAYDDFKQNERYLASQLPHPFESRQQYERSLRMPVGPEWMTKESFQQATKPRVIVKQGIIAPMSKPTI